MPTEPPIRLSGTGYFWLQIAILIAGVTGVWLSHSIGTWYGASTPGAARASLALVVCSVGAVGRATNVIVNAAFCDSYRVFRSRHLVSCTALLVVGAIAVAIPLITRRPFDQLFARGRITSGEIADLASAGALVVCTIGAVVAATGAWDMLRDERHWYRSLASNSNSDSDIDRHM